MTQVTHWLDLSQIYNSRKEYFDALNRDPSDHAKLLVQKLDGEAAVHTVMPPCPLTSPPAGKPNSCQTCNLSPARSGAQTTRTSCFIGGQHFFGP